MYTIMKQKTRKGLYTVLYPFMSSGVLNLSGLAKECFAVIFGFWFSQGQIPVSVSLTTMQTITGGTRSAVVRALYRLENSGLIMASRIPGKKTTYNVILPKQTLAEFIDVYADNKPVSALIHQEYTQETRTGQPSIPLNNKKVKLESVSSPSPLRVTAGEIRTGGLREA